MIGPNARLSNAILGERVTVRESVVVELGGRQRRSIGPFAHLRGETTSPSDVHVGNFVESRNRSSRAASRPATSPTSAMRRSAKGPTSAPARSPATTTATQKHETTIGRDVSIGSNTSLVAPVTVGDGALTGAGSVVTNDVPPGERVAGNPARPLPKK